MRCQVTDAIELLRRRERGQRLTRVEGWQRGGRGSVQRTSAASTTLCILLYRRGSICGGINGNVVDLGHKLLKLRGNQSHTQLLNEIASDAKFERGAIDYVQ